MPSFGLTSLPRAMLHGLREFSDAEGSIHGGANEVE
jgi:hypothetical protein